MFAIRELKHTAQAQETPILSGKALGRPPVPWGPGPRSLSEDSLLWPCSARSALFLW